MGNFSRDMETMKKKKKESNGNARTENKITEIKSSFDGQTRYNKGKNQCK